MLRFAHRSVRLSLLVLASMIFTASQLCAADTLESLVTGAKKEDELVFIAGAQTFGGRKGLSEIEAAFNKWFGLKTRINFAAGPDMNARAARHITEIKAGRKVSSDIFLGSQSHQALLHKENALEKVNYAGIFPWVTKEMEIFPNETVLTYTSPNGIVYNKELIPKDKAPKNYADLIDPKLSPTWAGKIAIPPYVAWLAELSLVWGQDKVKDYTRKLVAISGGRLRYSEEERVVSGEFPIMANFGDALSAMWTWQTKGAPLIAVPGVTPVNTDYFQLSAPKNAVHPNLAKLFVAFMTTKEAQAVLQKHESRSSHLVEGTLMQKYLKENKVAVQEPKLSIGYYLKTDDAEGLQFKEELAKILKGS
ncbi:MAG TPA: extracellular solute-binding protein [Candidatus Saccharimonadales bacterium]|nr:extracellular solute-binding protein [Candidatus Saccharimonadales bacterium]